MSQFKTAIYAPVILRLLQDVLYNDEKLWKELLSHQDAVSEYFSRIGIDLVMDETEGFAYLIQPEPENENDRLPQLIRKTPLTYEVTLICVLLREMLEEFDIKAIDSVKFYITNKEIKDKIELFFKERSNQVKLLKNFDAYINSVVNLGFLKVTREDPKDKDNTQYEVKRILKAKISNEKLEEIKNKLDTYVGII